MVYKYFHEVEYGSDEWKNSLAPTFKSPETFDDSQAVWSWHVEDKDGNVVSKDKCKISSVSMNMYEKIAGIKYERPVSYTHLVMKIKMLILRTQEVCSSSL